MNNFLFVAVINGLAFFVWLIMFFKNKEKAVKALKIGWQTVFSMLPLILIIIGFIGIFSSFINPADIAKYFGDKAGIGGFIFVSIISSFLQIPGVIAFPIAATLYQGGAAVSTVAVFACASTMSSVFTLPIEMKYLGKKLPILRVFLTYIICVTVGLLTGVIFNFFK